MRGDWSRATSPLVVAMMGELGSNFGKYTLLRRLASGGMSKIYLARQRALGDAAREVVIKCIASHRGADRDYMEMFLDEARIVARLAHPNIVSVHEFGVAENRPYMMMEYVPGVTLEDLLTATVGLEPTHALRIASEVCAGLHYAHSLRDERGEPLAIVHRDVTPQNVLIGEDGSVKLIDFGIAKAAIQAHRTDPGFVKGRYAYMAPEQAREEPVDHRADVHAVGVLLWESLTGRQLFKANSVFETMQAVLGMEAPSVRQRHPELSVELDTIILKATAKAVERRYQSCAQLQDAIDEHAAAERLLSSAMALRRYLGVIFGTAEEKLIVESSARGERPDRTIRSSPPEFSGAHEELVISASSPHERSEPTIPMVAPVFSDDDDDDGSFSDAQTNPLMQSLRPVNQSPLPQSPSIVAEDAPSTSDEVVEQEDQPTPMMAESVPHPVGRAWRLALWSMLALLGVAAVAALTVWAILSWRSS